MKASTVADRQPPSSGRPRDPRIDSAVLRATLELLDEVGYADLTVSAVAARAGTTKPAIYRRWRGLPHLVHEAVFPADETTRLPVGGTLAEDVRAMVAGCRDAFTQPAVRTALPGLLAAISADPDLHGAVLDRFRAGVWGAMRDRMVRAVAEGEARPDVDPDALVEAVGGHTLFALLSRGHAGLDEAWVDRTTTLLLRGVGR